MSNTSLMRYGAAGVAAVVLALAGYAAVGSGSDSPGTTAAAGPGGANGPMGAPPSSSSSSAGRGVPPAMGTEATGVAATKAKAAAVAKYPGTVGRVLRLSDGSYVVQVIASGGEQHVLVSKDFKVTGVQQGPGAAGGAPPSGATPPAGSSSASSAPGTTT